MLGLGLPELIVIFLVIFLLFGAKALPEIAKGLGGAIKILRREAKGMNEDLDADSHKDQPIDQSDQSATDGKMDHSHDFDPKAERRDWRPKV